MTFSKLFSHKKKLNGITGNVVIDPRLKDKNLEGLNCLLPLTEINLDRNFKNMNPDPKISEVIRKLMVSIRSSATQIVIYAQHDGMTALADEHHNLKDDLLKLRSLNHQLSEPLINFYINYLSEFSSEKWAKEIFEEIEDVISSIEAAEKELVISKSRFYC